MTLSRAKYRRLPDLYVTGKEVALRGGDVMWVQVLNPFQRDEATHDAQVARARIVMALKEDGAEYAKVEAAFQQDGRDDAIRKLADAEALKAMPKIVDDIASDPEWAERVEIMSRSDEILAMPRTAPEHALLEKINKDYIELVVQRQKDENDWQLKELAKLTDEQLLKEYVDAYLERRGAEVAQAEFQLTERWYAARVCMGEMLDDEANFDHTACEGHRMMVWETKLEAREMPEDLQALINETLLELNMTVRDARFSARQGSSSGSSPLPSEEAASTPSTPDETPASAPGT